MRYGHAYSYANGWADGETAVVVAAREGHAAVLEALFLGGADPQPANKHGSSTHI